MTSYPTRRPDLITLLRRYEHQLRTASPIQIQAIERKRARAVAALRLCRTDWSQQGILHG